MGKRVMRKHWLLSAVVLTVLGSSLLPATVLAKSAAPATKPMSLLLTRAGTQYLATGKAQAAIDRFDTALAVDPANVDAYIGLARAHEKIGLTGKSIRFYRGALAVDPNNLTALEGQGAALVARGALARAQINLARIKEICRTECEAAARCGRDARVSQPCAPCRRSGSRWSGPA